MVMKLKSPFILYQLRKFRKKYYLSLLVRKSSEGSKDQSGTKEGGKKSEFGPRSNFNDPNFDFHKELERLLFLLNLGRSGNV